MSDDKDFRVRALRGRDEDPPRREAFCVRTTTPENAASQIAMELERGGYYYVEGPDGAVHQVRIVPVRTWEAVECTQRSGQKQDSGTGAK